MGQEEMGTYIYRHLGYEKNMNKFCSHHSRCMTNQSFPTIIHNYSVRGYLFLPLKKGIYNETWSSRDSIIASESTNDFKEIFHKKEMGNK